MVLQVRSGAKPTTRCAHECVYASQVQPWLESSATRILQRKRANGCELVHTCLVGWRFRDHEDGKKRNIYGGRAPLTAVSASTKSPPTYVPAFACRLSSWPAFSRTLGSSVAQSFGSSRSMTRGITASPCLLQSAFSAASSRSTIITREPAANIASVLANPMPDAAPVTTATCPSHSLAIGLCPCWAPCSRRQPIA